MVDFFKYNLTNVSAWENVFLKGTESPGERAPPSWWAAQGGMSAQAVRRKGPVPCCVWSVKAHLCKWGTECDTPWFKFELDVISLLIRGPDFH